MKCHVLICHISYVLICHMSSLSYVVICHMSYVICDLIICRMSCVTCQMWYVMSNVIWSYVICHMSYDFMFQIYSIKIILLLNILLFIYYINILVQGQWWNRTQHEVTAQQTIAFPSHSRLLPAWADLGHGPRAIGARPSSEQLAAS